MQGRRAQLGWTVVLVDPLVLERAKAALGAAGTSEAIHHALALAAGLAAALPSGRAPSSASHASAAR